MRKTKIVCTIGPASESVDVLRKLVLAGMDVMRLNFSHGDYEEHGRRIRNLRQVCAETGRTVAVLLDTKGPEIRTGTFRTETIDLKEGDTVTLTTEPIVGDAARFSVTYEGLPRDVHIGSTILIDDGLIELRVENVRGTEIDCRVLNGGTIKGKRGVNVPGVKTTFPILSEKDRQDILWGIEQGVDFIAASFVRRASDVLEIRQLLEDRGASHIQIIAKIENREGVENLDEILEVSDGLMVARGDLGVEIPVEEVPLVQKTMIRKCNLVGKPVITATQMLDSMQRNPRPTRAEASDVANAIFDGTSATMLSGETAQGKYPVESVRTMARIIERAEAALEYREQFLRMAEARQTTVTDVIGQAVANAALELDASAIIAATETGYTARMVAKYRPKAPVIAITPSEQVMRRLCLVWGVCPVKGEMVDSTDRLFEMAVDTALAKKLVRPGDTVVIAAGLPVGRSGTTNMMKVHQIGRMVGKGQGIGTQVASGPVVVARSAAEAITKMKDGAVLVTVSTDRDYMPALERAAALVTEAGGITSHAALVALNLNIPIVLGVENATSILQDGMEVYVYPEVGVIYSGKTPD